MDPKVKCEIPWKASVAHASAAAVGVFLPFSSTVSELTCVGRRGRKRSIIPISLYPSFVLTRKRQVRGGRVPGGSGNGVTRAPTHAAIPHARVHSLERLDIARMVLTVPAILLFALRACVPHVLDACAQEMLLT